MIVNLISSLLLFVERENYIINENVVFVCGIFAFKKGIHITKIYYKCYVLQSLELSCVLFFFVTLSGKSVFETRKQKY